MNPRDNIQDLAFSYRGQSLVALMSQNKEKIEEFLIGNDTILKDIPVGPINIDLLEKSVPIDLANKKLDFAIRKETTRFLAEAFAYGLKNQNITSELQDYLNKIGISKGNILEEIKADEARAKVIDEFVTNYLESSSAEAQKILEILNATPSEEIQKQH
jgi:hypothetical protein